jgi:hypothetical protein
VNRRMDNEQIPQVPGAIEGHSWKTRAAACGLLSIGALIVLISITAGNHGGFSRNLLQGIFVTTACFLFLAVVAPFRLWRTRRLDLAHDGLAIHNFWLSREIGWNDIAEVVVSKGSGGGATWYFPTVRLQNGKMCKITGLGSANDEPSAQRVAEKLAAAVAAYRS